MEWTASTTRINSSSGIMMRAERSIPFWTPSAMTPCVSRVKTTV